MENNIKKFIDSKDPDFLFKDCVIGGDDCYLIVPTSMSTKWNDDNARFRSCIVRKSDNYVVSQGFGKFCNFGERPDFQPWDNSWKIEARNKLDGSLLIVSKYKDELIIRTRGTTDARQMNNGYEIDLLMKKYPKAFNNDQLDYGLSLLFEWTTPSNIICIREHDEPTLTLVGAVNNEFAYYMQQFQLDLLGEYIEVNRPLKYEYSSIEECILDVDAWKGKEGVVLYSPDGQTLKKIKSTLYCEIHKISTGIKNINQVLDLFMATEKFTKYSDFYNYVEKTLDYEVAEKIKDDMLKICVAYCKVLEQLDKVRNVVDGVRGESFSRKEQALTIVGHWNDWRRSVGFQVLDNKEIDDKFIRSGIETFLNH
jgi:hypothetical protein